MKVKPTLYQIWGQGPDGPRFKVNKPVDLFSAALEAADRTDQSTLGFRYWVEQAEMSPALADACNTR